jgi:hypothetical protein
MPGVQGWHITPVKPFPSPGGWISWPPEKTIDDDELQALDYRFAKAIGGTIP